MEKTFHLFISIDTRLHAWSYSKSGVGLFCLPEAQLIDVRDKHVAICVYIMYIITIVCCLKYSQFTICYLHAMSSLKLYRKFSRHICNYEHSIVIAVYSLQNI